MPQLPEYRAPFDTQPNTPAAADVAPWNAGSSASALAGLGAGLADVSIKLMAAQKQADDADSVTEKHKSYLLDLQNVEHEARIRGQANGMRNYSTEMASWIDQRAKDDQETLPSDEARREYIGRVGSMMTKHVMEARQTEMGARLAHFNLKSTMNAEGLGLAAMKGPSMVDGKYNYKSYINDQSNMLSTLIADINAKSNLYGEEAAQKNRDKTHQEAALGIAEGLYQTGQYEPLVQLLLGTYDQKERAGVETEVYNSFYFAQLDAAYETGSITKEKYDQAKADIASGKISAKSVVKVPKDVELAFAGGDIDSEFLMKGMPHEKRFEFMQKIASAMKERGYKDLTDHKRRFSDYKSNALKKGADIPVSFFGEIDAYSRGMNGKPGIYSPETASALKDELRVAVAAGKTIKRLGMVPFKEHEQTIKRFAPSLPGVPGENAEERNRAESYVRAGAENIAREFSQDPVSFYRSVLPEVGRLENEAQKNPAHWQTVLGKREAYQQRMKGSMSASVRLLDNDERDRLVHLLQSETDPGRGVAKISQELEKYGRYAPRVLEEVKASKGVADEYAAVFDQSGIYNQNTYTDLIKEKKEREEALKSLPSDDSKMLRESLGVEAVNLRPAFSNAMGMKGFNGVAKLMQYDAENLVVKHGKTPEEAIRIAKERVLETYHVSSAAGSNVAFRKQLRGYGPANIERIESAMGWHTNVKNIQRAIELGEIKPFSAGFPPNTSEKAKAEGTADVLANRGKWVPQPGYESMAFAYQDSKGAWVYALDGRGNPLVLDLKKVSSWQIPRYMDPNAKRLENKAAPAAPAKIKRKPASAVTEKTPDVLPSDQLEYQSPLQQTAADIAVQLEGPQ